MKKIILILGTIILIPGLWMCEKESATDELSLVKTEEGGCNNMEFSEIKSADELHEDTILFSKKNDTLDIFVGINYICCTPFTTDTHITNDSILLTITDPCTLNDPSCYCWCMCYYTWDFLFVDFEQKEYAYKVVLIDPHVEEPVVYWEGTLDLSKNP
jgi:hypothetical protein